MGKYASSPEYADLTPIPLRDDMTLDTSPTAHPIQPLATIAYSPAYTEATAYLRAVMAANEFSERALKLTEDVIAMNPAHYTVWLYRAKCLKEMNGFGDKAENVKNKDLQWLTDELKWLDKVAKKHLKNYQIWHHRQLLMTLLPSLPEQEPEFLTSILSLDTKNYHVWTYRQWLCTRFPEALLHHPAELSRTAAMIDDDIHNNSAWNHRWFLVFGAEDLAAGAGGLKDTTTTTSNNIVDEDLVTREIEYVKRKIDRAPQNASAWNYLRGVLRRAGRDMSELEDFCLTFVGDDGDVQVLDSSMSDDIDTPSGGGGESKKRGVRSSHAVEWLGEIWGHRGDLDRSRRCWDALSQQWDPVRRNYWQYRRKKIEGQI